MDQKPIERRDVALTALSCAACVGRVERVLERLAGVDAVSVNLATGRASFRAGPGFDGAAMLAALDRAGYPAATGTFDLAITGLDCAACVGRVERAFNRLPGVRSAAVNLATGRARVTVAGGLVDIAALQDAAAKAGYRAEPAGVDGQAPAHRDRDGLAAAFSLMLALPLLLPMLLMPFGMDAMLPPLVQLGLASVVQAVSGARFYRGAFVAARNGGGSMDTLVALGSSAAFGLSLWSLFAHPGAPLYFEASATVIALVRVGKWLEGRARRETGSAIRMLDRLQPETATVRDPDGKERSVAASALRTGDLLLIRPGERIAADCLVREGSGSCDESLLTGEAMPVDKAPGSRLVGGAVNGNAVLLASVQATGAQSRLGRMVRMIEDAQAAKPPVQRLVDRVSAVFVPAVVLIALLTLAGWWLCGLGAGPALLRAVSVLVIACPCALGLATPAAIMAGIGAAARQGILVSDPVALEQAGRLRTVVFDKTGTLTAGAPVLDEVRAAPGQEQGAVLRLASRLQAGSEHPLARALSLAALSTGAAPADGAACDAASVDGSPRGNPAVAMLPRGRPDARDVPPGAGVAGRAHGRACGSEPGFDADQRPSDRVSGAGAAIATPPADAPGAPHAEPAVPVSAHGDALPSARVDAQVDAQANTLSGTLSGTLSDTLADAWADAQHGAQQRPAAAASAVRALPGRGIEGMLDGRMLRIGNDAMLREAGLDPGPLAGRAQALREAGRTVSFLADESAVLGMFAFTDQLKPGAAPAVAALRAAGLHVALLTGDNQGAAEAAGRTLGIDDVAWGALPENKAARIAALRERGPVAMVGDGVNDAAALAAADLGLAMATGTDAAMAAAGITLMRGDPMLVPAALDIAARTMRRIRIGLFWAFAYNLAGIPLAIAGLLSPVVAGAAMACSSVLVVGNALLLRRWRPRRRD